MRVYLEVEEVEKILLEWSLQNDMSGPNGDGCGKLCFDINDGAVQGVTLYTVAKEPSNAKT